MGAEEGVRMGILQWLRGIESEPPVPDGAGDTDTVRKIVGQLEAMPRESARFVAAFAYILGRVAHADRAFELGGVGRGRAGGPGWRSGQAHEPAPLPIRFPIWPARPGRKRQ